jgi:vitamin B12/bleomycin/antimicrobial peptide transport system ATP-binding/permease protein
MTSEAIVPPAAAARQTPPEIRRHGFWRDVRYVGRLIGGYLRADPWVASLLVAVILAAGVAGGALAVSLNVNTGAITDALIGRDGGKVARLLLNLVFILVAALVIGQALVVANYVVRWRWRAKYTRQFLAQWMGADRFYALQRDHRLENPEQRIQEDLFALAEDLTELTPELLATLVSVGLLVGLIWRVSHPLSLAPIGIPLTIPADMLVATVLFAAVWTFGAHLVGRPISGLEVARQRLEADFRHHLGQVREHGEAIAFERGGERERVRALGLFGLIGGNWRRYATAQVLLGTFNDFAGLSIWRFAPLLLSIPHILAGQMTVGQMTAAAIAFQTVLAGMAVFGRLYGRIATLRAGVARVRLLDEEIHRPLLSGFNMIQDGPAVALHDVAVALPDGKPLFEAPPLEVKPGDRILVRGRSGVGKSTLLRAMAGLWPYGAGRIEMPSAERVMFLPQRGYMPSGTLAELLSYPLAPSEADRARYADALRRLSLADFVSRLDDYADWRQLLSPGEQQRVAAVRALLRRPDFLFLDEATSALDTELEADLYRALIEDLPGTAIVSVAHRPGVARFHTAALDIAGGRATLADLPT